MTDNQIRAKTREKTDKLKKLADELNIVFSAKQRIDPETMMIENIVIFTDHENYPIMQSAPQKGDEAQAVIPENNEVKPDVESTNIHE